MKCDSASTSTDRDEVDSGLSERSPNVSALPIRAELSRMSMTRMTRSAVMSTRYGDVVGILLVRPHLRNGIALHAHNSRANAQRTNSTAMRHMGFSVLRPKYSGVDTQEILAFTRRDCYCTFEDTQTRGDCSRAIIIDTQSYF